MMIRTRRALFVLDDENSDGFIQHYRTEVDLMELEITIDNTMKPPYFQIFRWFKEDKRKLNERLFALKINVFNATQKPDLDNAFKVVLDCLQSCKAITNDRNCVKIEAEKFVDKLNPRIEFVIEEV